MLRESIKAADYLDAEMIVVHTGYNSAKLKIKNPEQNMAGFFSKFKDGRIVLENTMIEYRDINYVTGNTPETFSRFIRRFGFGFCLDFSHAAATAVLLGKDYKTLVRGFLKLKPAYFHVSDNLLNGEDQHLHLGKGSWT